MRQGRLGLGAPLPHTPASNAEPGPPGPALLQLAPSPRPPRREIDGLAGMGNPPMEADAIQPAAAAAVELPARLADGVDAKVATSSHRAAEPVAQRALSGSAAAASTSAQPVLQRAVARPLPPSLPLPPMAPAAPTIGARPGLLTVRRPAGEPAALASEAAVESPWRRLSAVTTSAPPAEPAAGSRAERSFEGNPRANSPLGAIAAAPSVQALSYRAPVVQRASGAPQDFVALSPFATPSTGSSSTQRAVAVDEPAVQREVAAGEAPDLGPGIAAGPAAETAASVGGVAAAAAGQSEKDLDDLARKLHDRITQQLRRDLLIQRERAGLVTDLR